MLEKQDLTEIQNVLNTSLAPMQRLIEKHEYTLYGTNGTEGICSDLKAVKKRYDKLLRTMTVVYLVSMALILAVDRFLLN